MKINAKLTGANKDKLIKEVKEILKGIDETQTDSEEGWWETSTGAEFGYSKLEDIIVAIEDV